MGAGNAVGRDPTRRVLWLYADAQTSGKTGILRWPALLDRAQRGQLGRRRDLGAGEIVGSVKRPDDSPFLWPLHDDAGVARRAEWPGARHDRAPARTFSFRRHAGAIQ